MLNFGRIVKYFDRGFGFVTKELITRGEVYFHISQFKRKYPQLAQRIDMGEWRDIRFFFVTQISDRGESVNDIWLTANDLPQNLKDQLKDMFRPYWYKLADEFSIFEDFFSGIYTEEELKKLTLEKFRRSQVREFCEKRQIKLVLHFTRTHNVKSILEHGLLSRSVLDEKRIEYVYNDEYRIDRQYDAVCVSISFPNYKMFYSYRHGNPSEKWAVLILKASLLWELSCAFCRKNAASNEVTQIPLEDRRDFRALEAMFSDLPDIRRESLGIPDNYPTDPQAEVLVFERIPVEYIKEIHFENENEEFLDKLRRSYPSIIFCNDSLYFRPRRDWEFWQRQNIQASSLFWSIDYD